VPRASPHAVPADPDWEATLTAAGLLLGVLIWLVMDLIVLPLSRARPTPVLSGRFVLNLVAHAVLVGLPIALLIRGSPRR